MKQGVLTPGRVRVLMSPGDQCFAGHNRRAGERRRKSVRGCIVSPDLSVLNLIIVKKGEADIPGLTDEEKPRQRGPKRASKIRKMFNLNKDDDVRHYVKIYSKKIEKVGGREGSTKMRKENSVFTILGGFQLFFCHSKGVSLQAPLADKLWKESCLSVQPTWPHSCSPPSDSLLLQNGKTSYKCPKIQRLVTPQVLQRKRQRAALKRERIVRKKAEASDYHKLLVSRLKEARERRSESLAKKRAVRTASQASKEV
jgi:hypothetical protein